jgi:hypothetical protein
VCGEVRSRFASWSAAVLRRFWGSTVGRRLVFFLGFVFHGKAPEDWRSPKAVARVGLPGLDGVARIGGQAWCLWRGSKPLRVLECGGPPPLWGGAQLAGAEYLPGWCFSRESARGQAQSKSWRPFGKAPWPLTNKDWASARVD